MTRDEFKGRVKGLATQFHRVAADELRGTPWLFWIMLALAAYAPARLLWWMVF